MINKQVLYSSPSKPKQTKDQKKESKYPYMYSSLILMAFSNKDQSSNLFLLDQK